MIVLDIIICILLFAVPFAVLVAKQKKADIKSKIKQAFKSRISLLLHSCIGVFFAFTYIAFRYFYSPWSLTSFFHIYLFFASIAFAFSLAYLCKGTSASVYKTVAIVLSCIIILSPISRPILLFTLGSEGLGYEIETDSFSKILYYLPLNLSNISAILYIVAVLTNSKILKNFMATGGLFGGLINNVQIHNTQHSNSFYFYLNWESYTLHALMIIIPLFMLLTNQIKLDSKAAIKNVYWIMPQFLIWGFVLNPYFGTNVFFTQPHDMIKKFALTLDNPPYIFGSIVDPLFMIFFMGVMMLAGILTFKASQNIARLSKFFVDNSVDSSVMQEVIETETVETPDEKASDASDIITSHHD